MQYAQTSTPFHKIMCKLILRFSVSARRRKETMRASSIDDNAAMTEKMSVKLHMTFRNGVPASVHTQKELSKQRNAAYNSLGDRY